MCGRREEDGGDGVVEWVGAWASARVGGWVGSWVGGRAGGWVGR